MPTTGHNKFRLGIEADTADLIKATRHAHEVVNQVVPHDQAVWLPVAAAVLRGVYDHADRSLRESITLGLRSCPCADARTAILRLWPDGVPQRLML